MKLHLFIDHHLHLSPDCAHVTLAVAVPGQIYRYQYLDRYTGIGQKYNRVSRWRSGRERGLLTRRYCPRGRSCWSGIGSAPGAQDRGGRHFSGVYTYSNCHQPHLLMEVLSGGRPEGRDETVPAEDVGFVGVGELAGMARQPTLVYRNLEWT